MAQQLLSAFIQSFVISLLGGYGGYRYAIRNTRIAERPSGSWQLWTCLISGIGGAALAVAFEVALVIAIPSTDTSKLVAVSLLLGLAIAVVLTQRFLNRGK